MILNPRHHETRGNLALLDVAGGYFSRLEYASHGSLQSSLVSEFAYIAREYVNNLQKKETTECQPLVQGQNSASATATATASALRSSCVEEQQVGTAPQLQLQDMTMASSLSPLMPNFTPEQAPAIFEPDGMMVMEHSGSLSMDFQDFPTGGIPFGMNSDYLLGTDVMDLFNYSLPSTDPFFTHGF